MKYHDSGCLILQLYKSNEINFLLILFRFICNNFSLATDLPKCHFGDTVCLTKIVDTYVRANKHGRPDANIVSIDPLFLNEVSIIQGNDSPVNIQLNFKNASFYGLSNLRTTKVV